MTTTDQRRLLTLCAIRVGGTNVDWHLLARVAQRPRGLDALHRGDIWERSPEAAASLPVLTAGLADLDAARQRVEDELAASDAVGARLITVLDDDYPANLRMIRNPPPFLFVRGTLVPADIRSVAVVGTRTPSDDGLTKAAALARELALAGVTVTSGLARGIDTVAHESALTSGGRTIAVLGTGITRSYPPENADLAERITKSGALVSQFWPTASPGRGSFPRRNHVTSGISQGTVVIEASATSGAKMQARIALEQGKQAFLIRSLVTSQEWARRYVERRGAVEVGEVADVIRLLASPERVGATVQRRQLALDLS